MIETLITVASQEETLSDNGRKELLDVLVFVKANHGEFFSDGEWLDRFYQLVEANCQEPCKPEEVDAAFKAHISQLRRHRVRGTLSLDPALQLIRDLVHAMVEDKRATFIVDRINLEGMVGH